MNSWITQSLFDENISEFAQYIRNNSNDIEHVEILNDKFKHYILVHKFVVDIGDAKDNDGIKSDVKIQLTVSFHPSYQVPVIYFKYYKHDYKIVKEEANEQEIEEDLQDLQEYEDWKLSFNLEFFYRNVILSSKSEEKSEIESTNNNNDINTDLNITSIDDDEDIISGSQENIDTGDTSILSVSSITIAEHHLNLSPWFFVHPCNTREFVDEITNNADGKIKNINNDDSDLFKEWICKWWDFYGSIIV
ncbi:unnamed protein product [[Candida] boidinii]|nr:unnamed protein product [[Candida] boidinii]